MEGASCSPAASDPWRPRGASRPGGVLERLAPGLSGPARGWASGSRPTSRDTASSSPHPSPTVSPVRVPTGEGLAGPVGGPAFLKPLLNFFSIKNSGL